MTVALRWAAASVLLASALAWPAAVHPAATTTWKLVRTECTTGQKQVGNACWDPRDSNYTDKWQVGESSASQSVPGQWDVKFTYTVPQTVPAGEAPLALGVTVTSHNNSGAHFQVCVTGGFSVVQPDPCVRAGAEGNDKSNSVSGAVTIKGYRAAAGAHATVEVRLGDGGHVYFTYEAQTAQPSSGPASNATVGSVSGEVTVTHGDDSQE